MEENFPEEEQQKLLKGKEMSIWDHLDDLRGMLFRSFVGIFICMIIVFLNADFIFSKVIFAASSSDFILYRGFCKLGELLHMPSICPDAFKLQFQNTQMGGQFFVHINTSLWLGFILACPWVIFQLWRFVKPALYPNEQKSATWAFAFGAVLFLIGVCVGYFLVFPLASRFLGTYQLMDNDFILNEFNITSYIGMLVTMTLIMGLVFELPILAFFLSRMGIIDRALLRKYRRYAIVVILILAAIITPTPDPFTMFAVAVPIQLLYEFSIFVCKKNNT